MITTEIIVRTGTRHTDEHGSVSWSDDFRMACCITSPDIDRDKIYMEIDSALDVIERYIDLD
jgi:hypothetical protein